MVSIRHPDLPTRIGSTWSYPSELRMQNSEWRIENYFGRCAEFFSILNSEFCILSSAKSGSGSIVSSASSFDSRCQDLPLDLFRPEMLRPENKNKKPRDPLPPGAGLSALAAAKERSRQLCASVT
jgi:hypothetical protein